LTSAYGVPSQGRKLEVRMKKVDPKVDEAIQTLNMKDGPSRRKLLTGTGLVSATAAASALLAACSSSSSASSSGGTSTASAAAGAVGNFPKTPPWQFWFVNHVTTNLFFVPTQFGFADAAALLGLPKPKWGGSQNSIPSEMVTYMQTATSAKAAGIATTVINSKPSDTTFATPVSSAMNAGIPVVSYNADGPILNGVAQPRGVASSATSTAGKSSSRRRSSSSSSARCCPA